MAMLTDCSRRTWCNYEAASTVPNAELLARLDSLDFDIVFIVAGRRILRVTQSEQVLIDRLCLKKEVPA